MTEHDRAAWDVPSTFATATIGEAWLAVAARILDAGRVSRYDGLPILEIAQAMLDVSSPDPDDALVARLADPERAWLVVAMASTLAGNFTLVGSVANLIVAERAKSGGVTISFLEYFKVGAPLTLLTILFGVYWL